MNSSQNLCSPSTARKYDLVLFDLDGTLLDTSEGILSAVRYTIAYYQLIPLSEERIRRFIGPPIQNSFIHEYGVSPEMGNEYAAVFRDRYKDHDLLKAVLYPGIVETLMEMKSLGCKLAVATYKREDYALKLLDSFGLLLLFDVAHGSNFSGMQKKSDIIQMCIDEVGVTQKNKIVLVGDTESDRIGAQEVGVDFIAATYGFGYSEEDSFEKKINTPEQLLNYLR